MRQSSNHCRPRSPHLGWLAAFPWFVLTLCSAAAEQPASTLPAEQSEIVFTKRNSPTDAPMHIGFSAAMFAGLNSSDARNSIKALTVSIAREVDIIADPDPLIYENTDEAENILHRHLIGAISMTTSEYWLLRRNVEFNRFLINTRKESAVGTYLLLTREGSDISSLADLKGKKLIVYSSPAMCLATAWLDVELAKKTLPQTTVLLGNVTEFAKPTKVVLPVFFGQADACLITRYSFDTMVELNPQVGRQLRIIATSPEFITTLFGFRADLSSALTEKSILAFVKLRSSIAGRQTLAIFKTEDIAEGNATDFDSSLALLDEHARLCPEASTALIASLRGLHSSPLPMP